MAVVVRYVAPALNAAVALAAAAEAAVQTAGNQLLAASQPLVPVDTGELKASGNVTSDGLHKVRVSYSAIAEDGYNYAVRQHEDLTLHHPNGGQAHFLSQPVQTEAAAIAATLGSAIRRAL